MALVLREDDVRAVLTMPDVVNVLDATFRRLGQGAAQNRPRSRIVLPEARGVFHLLSGYVPGQPGDPAAEGAGLLGLKTYTAFATGVRFAVMLFSAQDGQLLALIEADLLGQMRTGAASGVATRHLARPDAEVFGLIGTGGQAFTQALAVCAVRPIKEIHVYGRDPERRAAFAERIAEATGVESVTPAASAEALVRASDIIVTATTAREPVLQGKWLRHGAHVNAVGSNWRNRREVDDETIERSDVVVVDALDQAHLEAGDLAIPAEAGRFDFNRAVELGALVAGQATGRNSRDQITFFKSLGLGLEDVATAGLIYARALERGLGQSIEFLP